MPTTKELEGSCKQIVIHKSATSIALARRDPLRVIGRSEFDDTRERIKETKTGQINLFMNDDDVEI